MVFVKVASASYNLSYVSQKKASYQSKTNPKKQKKLVKSVKKAKRFCGLRQKAKKTNNINGHFVFYYFTLNVALCQYFNAI